MIRVALLRGINVGGQRKIQMSHLRAAFERAGAEHVRSYIASGNVIFVDERPTQGLTDELEAAIEADFGFAVPVLLLSLDRMQRIRDAIPPGWASDATMRADVWFLWPDVDGPDIIERLPIRDEVDDVRYVSGAVLWHVHAQDLGRSGRSRVVGTDVYPSITIRNVNTVRKLTALMESQAGQG